MIYFFFGIFIGYLSWGSMLEMTILSLTLFFVYLIFEKRSSIFLFALGYYLITSRGLFLGVDHYYSNVFYGLIVWSGISLLSSLAWTFIWSESYQKRLYLFPIVLLFITLPPLGFISGVNPLPSIAILFPSFGFLGLFLEIVFIYSLAFFWQKYQIKKYGIIIPSLFFSSFISLLYLFSSSDIQMNKNMGVICSSIEYSPVTFDKSEEYRRIKKFFSLVQEDHHLNLLLPENALGNYNTIQSMVWRNLDKNKTIFAGANIYDYKYRTNTNVLMKLDFNSSQILYKQRVPLPIEMWRPFTHRGTEATLYKNPIVRIKGKNIGVFICYEQLLTYPYLQTFFYHPEGLIGISNLYWARGTNITTIQEQTMQLWSRLFAVPLSFSVNE